MKDYIRNNIQESVDAKIRLLQDEKLCSLIENVCGLCIEAYRKGNKILVCGNGGSASDAQHMTGELVGRYKIERAGIPAISLNANTAVMTALGNDYDYDSIFSKQVKALGAAGDVLFVISTSGNSMNTVLAAKQAKAQKITTVALTGEGGGKLKEICDYTINVPSANTPRIQEMHILVIHTICGIIEKELKELGFFEEN
ncbi:MAG: D-sedoheptulose 7-phosphate isomerase [Thermoflexaceae bacterium]|nr:D-sedoheptulose 7-phosphate isomerase [Thermoflexaceae bacterium]